MLVVGAAQSEQTQASGGIRCDPVSGPVELASRPKQKVNGVGPSPDSFFFLTETAY